MTEVQAVQLHLSPDAARVLAAAFTLAYAHTEHAKAKMGTAHAEFSAVTHQHFTLVAEHTTPEVWAEAFNVLGNTSQSLLKSSGLDKVREGLATLRGLGDAPSLNLAQRLEGIARRFGLPL